MEVSLFDGTRKRCKKIQCYTFEEAEQLLNECALKPLALLYFNWDYENYPELSVSVNGRLATLCYFDNEEQARYGRFGAELSMWITKGCHNGKVSFLSGDGSKTSLTDGEDVVSLEDAIECVKRFFDDGELPECIEWERLT